MIAALLMVLAGNCAPVALDGCNTNVSGRLEQGDCMFADGRRYDLYEFDGFRDQVVEVTVRPLSPGYRAPWIALDPPIGDPAQAPVISGMLANNRSGAATVRYLLTSTGTWRVAVSSDDASASGDYVLHVSCGENPHPDVPRNCIEQRLLCGQRASWTLTPDGCEFINATSVYGRYSIWAMKGDTLRVDETSTAFAPRAGLYFWYGNPPVKRSTPESPTHATLSYVVQATGWHFIAATNEGERALGDYTLSLQCTSSGCTPPYLTTEPATTLVRAGHPGVIPFEVNVVGPFTARLREGLAVVATSENTSSIVTPPVTSVRSYVLDVTNACGTWTSKPFQVVPDEDSRRRSVRR